MVPSGILTLGSRGNTVILARTLAFVLSALIGVHRRLGCLVPALRSALEQGASSPLPLIAPSAQPSFAHEPFALFARFAVDWG